MENMCTLAQDFFLQFFPGNFTVPENLGKKPTSDRLAAVDRNNGTAAVGVLKKVVASLDSDHFESKAPERFDEVQSAECGKRAHAVTETRWTPMN
jgi:hypothetical protein